MSEAIGAGQVAAFATPLKLTTTAGTKVVWGRGQKHPAAITDICNDYFTQNIAKELKQH